MSHLPVGPASAAARASIAEGPVLAWFANRGIGRAVRESLRATMDWFLLVAGIVETSHAYARGDLEPAASGPQR
ncbi:MAG: hypothetical protein LH461_00380 [Spirochaetaceae bacterium]|nr:hypothetical protein [Spirochaetaceae bacterium]